MNSDLKILWATELDILQHIHEVCITHHLKYSLAYGTLIGAVRHKGFIPWDDDIDIIMPREDYEKLLAVWPTLPIASEYILQNKYTDSDYTQNFSKIRKNHTTFVQMEEELHVKYHTGVFVDIFPGDRVACGVRGKIQLAACAINLLLARNFPSGNGGLMGIIEKMLLAMPEKIKLFGYRATDNYIKHCGPKEGALFFPSTIGEVIKRYPGNMFEEMVEIEFCNRKYMCINGYKAMLEMDYGDYMKLPPKDEQIMKHHPILLDITHNRDEIMHGMQDFQADSDKE